MTHERMIACVKLESATGSWTRAVDVRGKCVTTQPPVPLLLILKGEFDHGANRPRGESPQGANRPMGRIVQRLGETSMGETYSGRSVLLPH